MPYPADPPAINWCLLTELLGAAENDPEQCAQLADMWCGVVEELRSEWLQLHTTPEDAPLRILLHRMRGFVLNWGLSDLAAALQQVETAPKPAAAWQAHAVELLALRDASLAAIRARYPFLSAAA